LNIQKKDALIIRLIPGLTARSQRLFHTSGACLQTLFAGQPQLINFLAEKVSYSKTEKFINGTVTCPAKCMGTRKPTSFNLCLTAAGDIPTIMV
jgi:hypothetical protein